MKNKTEFLSDIEFKVVGIKYLNIFVSMKDSQEEITKMFKWDENCYDFWDTITFKGVMYDIHICFDEKWSVSIFKLIENEKEGVSFIEEFKTPKAIKETEERNTLIDDVIEDIKVSLEYGDSTVLAEILEKLPTEYLKGCLPEEE
jgi:hypothetical protein